MVAGGRTHAPCLVLSIFPACVMERQRDYCLDRASAQEPPRAASDRRRFPFAACSDRTGWHLLAMGGSLAYPRSIRADRSVESGSLRNPRRTVWGCEWCIYSGKISLRGATPRAGERNISDLVRASRAAGLTASISSSGRSVA